MKRWQWVLLIFELALFAAILILPQVDLPDFTFHGGTAPVAAKARLSSVPIRSLVVLVRIPVPGQAPEGFVERDGLTSPRSLGFRLSLLCTLVC
jgi:hypothetical protein